MIITKCKDNQEEVRQRICKIIQWSYQHYFKILNQLQGLMDDDDDCCELQVAKRYGGVKFFWEMLLVQEVPEGAVHDIDNFQLDEQKILFFAPSTPGNVQSALDRLEQ
ncbi:MAG: hypothetical protein AAF335_03235 [Bacteroidota bacterium]